MTGFFDPEQLQAIALELRCLILRIIEKSLWVSLRGRVIEDAACSLQGIDRQLAHADAMTVFTPFPKLDDLDAPPPRLHE